MHPTVRGGAQLVSVVLLENGVDELVFEVSATFLRELAQVTTPSLKLGVVGRRPGAYGGKGV